MKWSTQDFGKLWTLLGRPKNFLLLDATLQIPVAYLVAQRAWATGGFRAIPIGEAGKVRPQAPAVMVHTPADLSASNLAVEWMAKRGASDFKIVQLEENRELRFEGAVLPSFKNLIPSRCSAVTLIGSNRRDVAQIDLPATVEANSENPSDFTRFVEISARCSGESMPAPAWFRLPCQSGSLSVDILPGLNADQWQVTFSGQNADEIPPPESPFKGDPPARIALIFDRTCPASDHWSDAKFLMSPSAGKHDYKEQVDSAAAINPGEYNRQIRDGARAALVRRLGQNRTLDLFYFADSQEGGMGNHTDPQPLFDLVRTLHPPFDESSFDGLEALLSYRPGLDVWDPLQQAFHAAFEYLQRDPMRFGILIVGNSPPDFPSNPSPLQKIAEVFGYPTSFRRQSAAFGELLAYCESIHVPVVYLFLTQQCPKDEKEHRDFNRFRQLEAKIQGTLEECLPVVHREATAEGVAKGVEEAISLLDDPGIPKSTVRLK